MLFFNRGFSYYSETPKKPWLHSTVLQLTMTCDIQFYNDRFRNLLNIIIPVYFNADCVDTRLDTRSLSMFNSKLTDFPYEQYT